jgi:hypothetical protein
VTHEAVTKKFDQHEKWIADVTKQQPNKKHGLVIGGEALY